MNFLCPKCQIPLRRHALEGQGVYWACDSCQGRSVGLGLLARLTSEALRVELWRRATAPTGVAARRPGRSCPVCTRAMVPLEPFPDDQGVELDVCRRCPLVWFDFGELEKVESLRGSVTETPPGLSSDPPPDQARVMGREILRTMPGTWPKPAPAVSRLSSSSELWQAVPAIMGLPVEENPRSLREWPVLTWILILAVAAVSVRAFQNPALFERLAFVPAEAFRGAGWNWFTLFFVHAGWFHLIGNLYTLAIFGDDVEDSLGQGKFLLLVLLSVLLANAFTLQFTGQPELPHVGASGGSYGVLAFYLLEYPRARVRIFRLQRLRIRPIQIQAGWGVAFLLVTQFLGAMVEARGQTGIGHLSHLGGALGGVLLWLAWGRRER